MAELEGKNAELETSLEELSQKTKDLQTRIDVLTHLLQFREEQAVAKAQELYAVARALLPRNNVLQSFRCLTCSSICRCRLMNVQWANSRTTSS